MGRVCAICKREQNPLESRSFHRFPADDELKKKWMCVTGLSSVTKHTVICEDHFTDSSFHNTGEYIVRRRLLSNAIPKNKGSQDRDLKNAKSNIESDHNYTKCYEGVNTTALNDIINNQSRISFDNTSNWATNAESEYMSYEGVNTTELNDIINNQSRISFDNTSNWATNAESENMSYEDVNTTALNDITNNQSGISFDNISNWVTNAESEYISYEDVNTTELNDIINNQIGISFDNTSNWATNAESEYISCEDVNTTALNDIINNQSRISFDNISNWATNAEAEYFEISDGMEINAFSNDDGTIVNIDNTINSCKKYSQSMISSDNTLDLMSDAECIDISDETMKKDVFFTDGETYVSMDNATNNRKRKLPSVDVRSKKRIRFMTGFKTEHLSRQDFVSDESWERFLRYHIDNKRQLKSAKKTNARKQKRIYEYKLLIRTLI